MKILKVINNNVVSSVDLRGREVIVMGKGLGFQKHVGDTVNEDRIEKVFSLPEETSGKFAELVKDMSYEHMQLAEKIIARAKKVLGKKLNKNIYITLTDHLDCAIERNRKGIELKNAFLWEIQKYYQLEYQMGLEALLMVKQKLGVELSVDEAAFLALHFVNAEMDTEMTQSATMPEILRTILSIIEEEMHGKINDRSLAYERLLTHLKFFLQRVVKNETYESEDDSMSLAIKAHCRREIPCAERICAYVKEKLGYETSGEEIIYLLVHLHRVARAACIREEK